MTRLRQLWLLTAIAALVILAGGWFLLVTPKANEVSALREEAEAQLAANHKIEGEIAMLRKLAKTKPEKQKQLDQFDKLVPPNPGLPSLVRALSNAADDAGVEMVMMTPGEPAVPTAAASATTAAPVAVAHIPVKIEVNGTFTGIMQFFSEVEGLPRAYLVTAVDVERDKSLEDDATAKGPIKATLTGRVLMATKPPAATPVTTTTTTAAE